jgi:hypothetical protein
MAVNDEFLQNAKRCVLNPGCFYSHSDEVVLINRRAKALRSQTSINLNGNLHELWERKKRVPIRAFPEIGRLTLRERIALTLKRLGHRAAFLLPA